MPANEDTFTFPPVWRELVLPRRGGVPGPELIIETAGAAELMEECGPLVAELAVQPDSDPELVAAVYEYLADPAKASARAAGTMAAVAAYVVYRRPRFDWHPRGFTDFADAWVATHGVVYAAEAAIWMNDPAIDRTMVLGKDTGARILRVVRGVDSLPYWTMVAGRVRAHLAAASDADYAAATAALERMRAQHEHWRPLASFLVPTQRSWVDADCAEIGTGFTQPLWYAACTVEHVAALTAADGGASVTSLESLALTLVEGVGPALAGNFLNWLDNRELNAEMRARLLTPLARFPTDEALLGLIARLDRKFVTPVAIEAIRRFPRRALRLLAADQSRAAADQLRIHVLAHPELAAQGLESLPPHARARVEAVLAEADAVIAPDAALPEVLVSPPWTVQRTAAKPIVLTGLAFDEEPTMVWAPGEHEEWAAKRSPYAQWWKLDTSVETVVAAYTDGRLSAHHTVVLMTTAPREVVEPLLADWEPGDVWAAADWMGQIIANYGLSALRPALFLAQRLPVSCTDLLMPYASGDVALHMANAFARLKSQRSVAAAWLERHAAYAARALTPAALGKAGLARRNAQDAVRMLVVRHRDAVLAAADTYGPEARAGLEALLGADPLHVLPAKMPALPEWADPATMPRILLRDRSSALSDQAARHLCLMLAISNPGEVYAGVPLVREICDPRSLAEFGWSVFQQWLAVGAPPKDAWPMHALRWIGDDETVRRLSPLIRAWPGEGGHARALTGLDVLAEIGSSLALMHLYGIAQKAKFKGLKDRANEKVAEVAAGLGLTADQLGDRLVPDFGLDAAGSLSLDYGPRRFVVGFDEQLKPYVVDETGARRKDLPKPGTRDDERLAPEAYQQFSGLKKDVRTVAADQIKRLEAAMVSQRQWSIEDFRGYFVEHPLLWHIVRRLVWLAETEGAQPLGFRVAEDRTFADVLDDVCVLPAEATVRPAHPLHLGAQVAAWSEVFADYEILQPFPQLGRSVYALTDAEREAAELTRFAGLKVPTTTVLGLERRGWRRGEAQDGGVQGWLWRAIPRGRAVVVNVEPGIVVGAPDINADQEIEAVWVNGRAGGDWRLPKSSPTFGELDAVTASETLRDLTEVLAR